MTYARPRDLSSRPKSDFVGVFCRRVTKENAALAVISAAAGALIALCVRMLF